MALTKWSDNIAAAALQGNYNGFIQSSLLQLRLSGPISDSATNGIAVYNVTEITTYKVRLLMDTRFRVAACASIAMNTVMENYYRDAADTNGTVSANAYKETEITTQAGQVYMPVFYWASGSGKGWSDVYSTVEVYKQLTGTLELTTPPAKTAYNVGEELDLTGMVVSVVWSDGTKEAVTDYTVSGYDGSAAGTCTVVVTYQGESVSFQVTVSATSHILREYIGSPNLEDVVATLDTETWVMTISGTGAIKDFTDSDIMDIGDNGIPTGLHSPIFKDVSANIKEIIVEEGVTHIGSYAIGGYTTPKMIQFLMTLQIPDGSKFIDFCVALEKVTLAKSVVTAGEYAIAYTCVKKEINFGGITKASELIGDYQPIAYVWCPVIYTKIQAQDIWSVKGILEGMNFGLVLWEGIIYDQSTGYAYKENDTGLTLVGKYGVVTPYDETEDLTIPESYNGLSVTEINTEFSLPIANNTIINIPSTVIEINTYSFYSFSNNVTLNINKPVNSIAGVPWGANGTVNWTGIAKHLTGITISSLPSKVQYLINETFDAAGLVVTANYDDGTNEAITDYTLSGFDSVTEGNKTITVTYEGFTASFEVSVVRYVIESIGSPNPDDVIATLDVEMGTVTISGTGTMRDFAGNEMFPGRRDQIERVDVSGRVTNIGKHAFIRCANLKSVNISGMVVDIGGYSFHSCTNLKTVVITGECKTIGLNVFYQCEKLESITLPDSITSIEGSAFSSCSSLRILKLPDSLESLGEYLFNGCTSMESIIIPELVTVIEQYTFLNCRSLSSVDILGPVTQIGECAFLGCEALAAIALPESLVSLGANSFLRCSSLNNILIPKSVEIIGEGSFVQCLSLKSITINNKENSIPGAPWGAASDTTVTWLIEITSISVETLPDKVEYSIGEEFNTAGLTIAGIYNDGTSEAITGYTVSGFDSTAYGTKIITVTYQEFTTTFEVRVHGAVTGIRIAHYPNKIYYKLNEALDTTGLQVVAITEGGLERPVTDYTLSALDSSTVGRKEIKITYEVPISADTKSVYFAEFSVKVTADGQNPFEGGSIPYVITVHWPNGEFEDLTNKDIAGGNKAVTLKESICGNNYFIFGGCICNMIQFTALSDQFVSTDESAYPHGDIEVYVESRGTKVKIFTGKIDTGDRAAGLLARDITAYDYLYQYRNADIARWYRSVTVDRNMILTQKQFRDSLFDFLGIEQVPTVLEYDNALVPDTNATNEMNALAIIKDLCLQNSVFGHMNRDGKFEYLKLPENCRVKSMDNKGNLNYEYYEAQVHYDSFEECKFTEGRIWYPKQFYTYPSPYYRFSDGPPSSAQEAYENNVYYNRNSFFVGDEDWLDSAWQVDEYGMATVDEPVFPICYGTTNKTDNQHLYRAQKYELPVRGNPLNKVGDSIEITVRKTAADGTQLEWVIHSYIMSRTLKLLGDTCMTDTYSASNGPYNGNEQELGDCMREVAADTFRTRRELPKIVYDSSFTDGTRAVSGNNIIRAKCFRQIEYNAFQALSPEEKNKPGEIFFTYEEVQG